MPSDALKKKKTIREHSRLKSATGESYLVTLGEYSFVSLCRQFRIPKSMYSIYTVCALGSKTLLVIDNLTATCSCVRVEFDGTDTDMCRLERYP